jgi:hypothetical protein
MDAFRSSKKFQILHAARLGITNNFLNCADI